MCFSLSVHTDITHSQEENVKKKTNERNEQPNPAYSQYTKYKNIRWGIEQDEGFA